MTNGREQKQLLIREVEALSREMREIALYIFDHPELGYQEVKSSEALAAFLEGNGFALERGFAGMPTAFRAVCRKGQGPTVAFLAEYDALPCVGHACGHNLFGTASAAAGVALARHLPGGAVVVLGTPAEEGAVKDAGGKVVMVEAGVFKDIDAAITCHAEGRTILRQELISRAVLEMDFHGKAAHAAGAPEKGINALDAAVVTINAINALRQHLTPDVRVHGIVADGGKMINTIPDFTRLHYGVRAQSAATLESVIEKVLNCARAGALASGCRFEYRHLARPYLTLIHNEPLLEAFGSNLDELGERYIPRVDSSYSTDVGNVSQVVPTIHPYISIGGEHLVGHSPAFAEASRSEGGFRGMEVAAKAMAMTGYDILTDPGLLERARKAFSEGK